MRRLLLPCSAALAACAPAPQEVALPRPAPAAAVRVADPVQAALAPMAAPVSAAADPAPSPLGDTPAAARGRRILTTAFVRMGPGGHLIVTLGDARTLILRDVVMGPRKFCGVSVEGDVEAGRHCEAYAEVAAARPGPGSAPHE